MNIHERQSDKDENLNWKTIMTQHWRPDLYSRRKENLKIRQKVIKATRKTFDDMDFAEVDTPVLQHSPGNEVHLQAFKTEITSPHDDVEPETLYLHTSPEFAMKKLLVAGEEKIYQIAHVFRNGERSSRHHPEFSMIEWYRAFASTKEIQADCIELIRNCAKASGKTVFTANNMTCDPFKEWEVITVQEAFQKYAEIDLLATTPDPLNPDAYLLRNAMKEKGFRTLEDDNWDDLFFRVMGEKIEPYLGKDCPTFLTDYPLSMAALSRKKEDDPRLADRFELYVAGLELANAFGELTDPDEQLRRFEKDMDLKEELHGVRYPIDMDFIDALRHGMPTASGIALGIDRLVMLCAGTEDINDVLWLPVKG